MACETGIAPAVLMAETPRMLNVMYAYLVDRAQQE